MKNETQKLADNQKKSKFPFGEESNSLIIMHYIFENLLKTTYSKIEKKHIEERMFPYTAKRLLSTVIKAVEYPYVERDNIGSQADLVLDQNEPPPPEFDNLHITRVQVNENPISPDLDAIHEATSPMDKKKSVVSSNVSFKRRLRRMNSSRSKENVSKLKEKSISQNEEHMPTKIDVVLDPTPPISEDEQEARHLVSKMALEKEILKGLEDRRTTMLKNKLIDKIAQQIVGNPNKKQYTTNYDGSIIYVKQPVLHKLPDELLETSYEISLPENSRIRTPYNNYKNQSKEIIEQVQKSHSVLSHTSDEPIINLDLAKSVDFSKNLGEGVSLRINNEVYHGPKRNIQKPGDMLDTIKSANTAMETGSNRKEFNKDKEFRENTERKGKKVPSLPLHVMHKKSSSGYKLKNNSLKIVNQFPGKPAKLSNLERESISIQYMTGEEILEEREIKRKFQEETVIRHVDMDLTLEMEEIDTINGEASSLPKRPKYFKQDDTNKIGGLWGKAAYRGTGLVDSQLITNKSNSNSNSKYNSKYKSQSKSQTRANERYHTGRILTGARLDLSFMEEGNGNISKNKNNKNISKNMGKAYGLDKSFTFGYNNINSLRTSQGLRPKDRVGSRKGDVVINMRGGDFGGSFGVKLPPPPLGKTMGHGVMQ